MIKLPPWEATHDREFLVNGVRFLDALYETVEASDKENAKKPRAGSVPPRSKTPGLPTSSISTKPLSSGSDSLSHSVPNKRPRLASSSSRINTDVYSQETLPHRTPFSSRSGVDNIKSPTEDGPPGSVFKHGRTQSSSLPRPKSITKTHVPPIPQVHRPGYGNAIGLGYPSGGAPHEAPRSVSENKPAMPAVRSMRNARRESFKPRTSVDSMSFMAHRDVGGSRFVSYGQTVKEEDEY